MQLKITIDMDNDAFQRGYNELTRIFKQMAEAIEASGHYAGLEGAILDINGNTVGHVDLFTADAQEFMDFPVKEPNWDQRSGGCD